MKLLVGTLVTVHPRSLYSDPSMSNSANIATLEKGDIAVILRETRKSSRRVWVLTRFGVGWIYINGLTVLLEGLDEDVDR